MAGYLFKDSPSLIRSLQQSAALVATAGVNAHLAKTLRKCPNRRLSDPENVAPQMRSRRPAELTDPY